MSRAQTYAQLVRLPNVPTALADVCLGALAAGALPGRWLSFALLLPASACLYCAGMVWNDFFDVEQDRRERPFRPIPSGRVTRREAARLGGVLLAAGVVLALLAGWAQAAAPDGAASARPAALAVALVGAILLYDGWLKRTWAGPVGMGLCRFLNVLLGVSAAGTLAWPRGAHLALVVGLYIAGVTWFARTEARVSSRAALRGAAAVMLAALALALPLPAAGPRAASPLFPYLLVALGFVVGLPALRAVAEPTPPNVQATIKRAIFALVLLDAVLATAFVGGAGLLIALLLVPSLVLARRRGLYAT
jgi:4-hydroxybenzoate polyprenyltransferase